MTVTGKTKEDVCNDALGIFGGGFVTSIENPTSPVESHCARMYPLVVNSIFGMYQWSCANPERQLAVNADETPISNYNYAYRMPSAALSGPFAVYDNEECRYAFHDYKLSNDHIHTDAPSVWIKYRGISDISIWPSYLYELIVIALAARLAKPVADDSNLAKDLKEEAFGPPALDGQGGKYATAKRLDAISKPPMTIYANGDPLTGTRY